MGSEMCIRDRGPPYSTPLLRQHKARDEPDARAHHLHGLPPLGLVFDPPRWNPNTARATERARTKGTTALRHHQDGKGSSSQPTGYAVHVTPYLCAEKFIKSLTTDVRLGGGFFVCAQAARGPFSNARSACTCGGPAQRCCLLNATETEDPLLIHSMKLPFSRP